MKRNKKTKRKPVLSKRKKQNEIEVPTSVIITSYHVNKDFIDKELKVASTILFLTIIGSLLLTSQFFTQISFNYYVSSIPQERKDVYYTVDLPDDVQTISNLENKYKYLPNATTAEKKEQAAIARESQIAAIIASQVTDKVRRGGLIEIYQEAGDFFMIPWQILAAVHYVETRQSGDTTRTSYAGATGPMQFLPSTFAHYAVDGDGDGTTSIYDVHDAIFTAANYLSANGARGSNVRFALYRYNHSYSYVSKVLSIAKSMGYGK